MRPLRPRPSPLMPVPRSLRGTLLVFLLALVAGTTSACAHRAKSGGEGAAADEDAPMPIPEFVFVAVENHNWSDVVISVVSSAGQAVRLGTVTAGSSATLRFPGHYIAGSSPLQLQAKPVGGRSVLRSERFSVQPGQQVAWTIESSLQRSSLAIY